MKLTRSDLLALARWCAAHPREAARELVEHGWAGLVDAWETAELAAMLAAEEERQAAARRVVAGVIDAIVRETREERTEVYVGTPLFAMRVGDERWRVN